VRVLHILKSRSLLEIFGASSTFIFFTLSLFSYARFEAM